MTMGRLHLTTSWDDGHPLDLKLADLLARRGIKATFYVPGRNREGRPVLSTSELRSLSNTFSIGAHTQSHSRLDCLSPREARNEILDGKRHLEDQLGRPVRGFCYPQGAHNSAIREIVASGGFRYARTVVNLVLEAPRDPLRVPTTLQFHPHSRRVYLQNCAHRLDWHRWSLLSTILREPTLLRRLTALLDHGSRIGGIFHLWGHSWEIEQLGAWNLLDEFLRIASERVAPELRLDNDELYDPTTETTAATAR